jgi:septum formation protein
MPFPPIILASASPRRCELLRQMGREFRIVASDVEELHDAAQSAPEIARINAHRKAAAVAEQFPEHLVIGADTLVFLDRKHYGKPGDLAEATRMLQELGGQCHQVVTAVSLIQRGLVREKSFVEISQVIFKPLPLDVVQAYLSRVNVLDKAGAYAIQEHGEMLIREWSGSFSNIVGLPIERLEKELEAWVEENGL